MKITMTKRIGGSDHQIEVVLGEKACRGQVTSVQIDIYVDGGLAGRGCHYDPERQAVLCGIGKLPKISGQTISGFTVSAADAEGIEEHIRQATAQYQATFDKRVAGLLSGAERVRMWTYGMTITMVTLEHESGILDWIKVRDTAAKQWFAEHYPLVESWEYEDYDLHRGIMSPADVVRKIAEAEPSDDKQLSMGGEMIPKYVLVPITVLLQHTAAKKYQELSRRKAEEIAHRQAIIEAAKRTGERQVLHTYQSTACLDNLTDCSFDSVTEWIDSKGKISQTWTHCH